MIDQTALKLATVQIVNDLERSQKSLQEYATKVTLDAFEAFYWANSYIHAAAVVRVNKVVHRHLVNPEKGPAVALAVARTQAKNLASQGPVHSTAVLAATLATEELKAWMYVIELLEASGVEVTALQGG